jgi:hypothetical protein
MPVIKPNVLFGLKEIQAVVQRGEGAALKTVPNLR